MNVMKNKGLFTRLFILLFSLLLCSSCTKATNDTPLHQPPGSIEEKTPDNLTVQLPDSSCSYFYLLWGTHAENNRRYEEAEEAYEKALICDPDSSHILSRLPILLLRMGKHHGAAKWLRKAIKQFPEDIQSRIILARIYIQTGDIDDAITLYQEILAITPEDETTLLRVAFLYSKQNRFTESEQILTKILTANPDSFYAHLYLARLAKQTKKKKLATQYYQEALTLNWSVELALEVADYHGTTKEYQKVEAQYHDILKKHPDDKHAGLGLVHIYLIQDKEEKALEVLTQLQKSSSNPGEIELIMARVYLRQNEFERAATILQTLVEQYSIEEAIYMLAVIRFQQDKLLDAAQLLQKLDTESEFYEDGLYLQVRILIEEKELTKGILLLQEEINSKKIVPAEMYSLLASLYNELRMFDDGYKILETAMKLYPDETKILFEYGLLLEKEHKQEAAIKQMEKLLLLDPDHAEALNYIGYTWADMGIKLDQALQYIIKAVELKPDNGYIRDSLGWVYYQMGTLDKAILEINKALKLQPSDPYIHEHLGDIYSKLGNSQKAKIAYKTAQDLFQDKVKQKQMQLRIDAL